jgi:3-oxoacyl-[acyl-carrier protein] reductase
VIALTKTAAKEFSSRNICVNAVAPGFIQTPMTDVLSEEVKQAMLSNIPLKKFGQPEDVAKAVLFLAGADSDYITGQVINVNGGMLMNT